MCLRSSSFVFAKDWKQSGVVFSSLPFFPQFSLSIHCLITWRSGLTQKKIGRCLDVCFTTLYERKKKEKGRTKKKKEKKLTSYMCLRIHKTQLIKKTGWVLHRSHRPYVPQPLM
mmetsp:Transcript_5972/g.14368  ORF Transcript_5972/g.14368 Transcript_5972/m.14368 type:complete len:114 (-) Transcript_5972:374-715(-)